jgi:hypothetical protein
MSEYVGGQPQQTDTGAAVQSLDLRTANLTQELAQLLAQTTGGKPTPSAAATGSQFNTLQALVSTATQTQRSHQPGFRDGLSALSYARPAQQVAPPPPPAPAPVLTPPEPSLVAAPPVGFDAPASSFASAPSFTSAPGFASAPSFSPSPSFAPASNFAAPVSSAFMAPMAPVTNGLLVSDPHDDEPMPIPSTWRQPTTGDDDKWYRQQLGAAGLGLLAGLVVVVPAVLWLSGFLGGGSQAKSVRTAGQDVATVKVKLASAGAVEPIAVTAPPVVVPSGPPPQPPQRSALLEPPSAVAVVPPAPRPVEPPKSVEPPRSRADELVVQAKRRIEEARDVPGARDILQQAPEMATSGAMTFLLAETYDPNMLASWQTRGVMANPERARALYQRARELGDSRAQQRLDWLMAN